MSRRPKTYSRPGYRSNEDKRRALSRLAALDALLAGEPPYPVGTVVRELQDERDALRERADEC